MKEYLKTYTIKITALSPIHIGSGEKINKKEENIKIKTKIDGKAIFTKIMAVFLLVLMVLASSATCIYYVVQSL